MSRSDDLLLPLNKSQRFTSSDMAMLPELVVLEVLVDPDLEVDPDSEVDSEVVQDSVEDLDSEVELRLSEPHPLLMESTKRTFLTNEHFLVIVHYGGAISDWKLHLCFPSPSLFIRVFFYLNVAFPYHIFRSLIKILNLKTAALIVSTILLSLSRK
jgi:hypothetical protein